MGKAYGSRDLSESFQDVLTWCAKTLFWLGAVSSVLSTALLIVLCFRIAGDASLAAAASTTIDNATKVLIVGVVGVTVGVGYLFWEEDVASGILVLLSAVMYFSPMFLPSLFGGSNNVTIGKAMSGIALAGLVMGILSITLLVAEIALKIRTRAKVGVRADQLKYGKGIKEEADRQNVFLGNCWQLPYCRKFVRERCPIFHAKRTCWRERVGCMCEEEVIRNAMENKPIPKDAVLAGKMIPKNFRLTEIQKFERCKNCVIYNEHQRHKYRAFVWAIVIGYVALYVVLHGPLVTMVDGLVTRVNDAVHIAILSGGKEANSFEAPTFFVEGLSFVMALLILTYALKLLEYCIFKLKI